MSCFYRRHLVSHAPSFYVEYLELFALKPWLYTTSISDGFRMNANI